MFPSPHPPGITNRWGREWEIAESHFGECRLTASTGMKQPTSPKLRLQEPKEQGGDEDTRLPGHQGPGLRVTASGEREEAKAPWPLGLPGVLH